MGSHSTSVYQTMLLLNKDKLYSYIDIYITNNLTGIKI